MDIINGHNKLCPYISRILNNFWVMRWRKQEKTVQIYTFFIDFFYFCRKLQKMYIP